MQSPAPEVGPTVRHILGELKDRPGALLEALHALQGTLGYVPAEVAARDSSRWRTVRCRRSPRPICPAPEPGPGSGAVSITTILAASISPSE